MKTASLIFFYFGEDSYVNRLAQEAVPLHRAMEGYDHTTLLYHPTHAGPFELSKKAHEAAEFAVIPTKENFVWALQRLSGKGYDAIDVFIFSHGSPKSFISSKGTYGDSEFCTSGYLAQKLTEPIKGLRLVYQVNCYGSTLNPFWLSIGARAAVGTRDVNFYPTRFNRFIKYLPSDFIQSF